MLSFISAWFQILLQNYTKTFKSALLYRNQIVLFYQEPFLYFSSSFSLAANNNTIRRILPPAARSFNWLQFENVSFPSSLSSCIACFWSCCANFRLLLVFRVQI